MSMDMTDDDRRQITVDYFKRFDAGQDVLGLFADDAYVYFPKHAPARDIDEVRALFGHVGTLFTSIVHEVAYFNYVIQGQHVVVEGTTHGVLADGRAWRASQGLGGRFMNIFEIRDAKIQRLHIYLDPDYADADTARYPGSIPPDVESESESESDATVCSCVTLLCQAPT